MAFWSQFLTDHPEIRACTDGDGVRVTLSGRRAHVHIRVAAPLAEEVRQAWERSLADALQLAVQLTVEAPPDDAAAVAGAQAALRRWVAPEDI
ncbi:MAG: hypothetical protein ACP5QO_01490, partial [Clostridia bacterium]